MDVELKRITYCNLTTCESPKDGPVELAVLTERPYDRSNMKQIVSVNSTYSRAPQLVQCV